ncbi:nitroreductase family protein [uncultured Bilophila sp.]|uniref:nitroreductase family protein n=1 Tax=uncultured Bilophila sp. TaxID=529385 RepID=UPI00280B5804|nr:nitroreductase family protein [uncultured Bilophila sp.]
MDFLELVTGARTCRRFREAEGMPAGTLEWLVECARVTPCGGNAQALRFAAAETPEACAAVFPALKWAGMLTDWDGPEAGERPTGYLVILGEAGTRAKLNAIDAGIAAQTIQLAAYTRDLGCCIFLSFDPRRIRETLGIPENLEPLLVLALGAQKEVRRVETVGADGSVKYWRDAQGVHHVPKRPLKDLLIIKK